MGEQRERTSPSPSPSNGGLILRAFRSPRINSPFPRVILIWRYHDITWAVDALAHATISRMARHAIRSSLAAATPIALCYGYLYSTALWFLGVIALLWAEFVAFLFALCGAHLFLAIRKRVREPLYFLLHLCVGYGLGVLMFSFDARSDTFEERYTSRETMLPLVASMAAWAYLFLFDSPKWFPDSKYEKRVKVLLFMLASAALAYLPISRPYIENDSCHNVLRNQRSTIGLVESIRLSLPLDAEPKLRAYYDNFVAKHNLRAAGHAIHKDSAQTSMCNERVTFKAGGFFEGRHGISIYEISPDSEWRQITAELVCGLEEMWPGSMSFSGKNVDERGEARQWIARCYL